MKVKKYIFLFVDGLLMSVYFGFLGHSRLSLNLNIIIAKRNEKQ